MAATGEFARVSEMMVTAQEKPGQPVKRGTMPHEHDVMMQLTEAAAQSRELEALKRYAPRLEQLAERDDHKLYLAIASRGKGIANRLSGKYMEAEQDLYRSLEIFKEYQASWQTGRTLFEIGELHRENNELEKARIDFSGALVEFQAMHANPAIERVRSALAGLDRVENSDTDDITMIA